MFFFLHFFDYGFFLFFSFFVFRVKEREGCFFFMICFFHVFLFL